MTISSYQKTKICSLSFPELEFFLRLYELRSITEVANCMHLTVPAASRTLKKLRTTFDDTLFIRSNPLFLPSAKANELYPQVKDILQKLGQLIDPEEFSPHRLKRTFRLGVVDNAIHTVLTEFIENFYKIAPDCTLEFQYLDSRIFDKLEDNRLDVAILPTTEEVRGKIRQFLLYPNHFVLCVRRGHPLVQYYKEHGSVPASEIAKYRKVIVSNCLDVAKRTYTMDETTFDDEFKQEIACSTPYFTSVPNFLIHSDFTAFLPDDTAFLFKELYGADIEILPFTDSEKFTYHTRLIWHERTDNDMVMQWFRSLFALYAGKSFLLRAISRPYTKMYAKTASNENLFTQSVSGTTHKKSKSPRKTRLTQNKKS